MPAPFDLQSSSVERKKEKILSLKISANSETLEEKELATVYINLARTKAVCSCSNYVNKCPDPRTALAFVDHVREQITQQTESMETIMLQQERPEGNWYLPNRLGDS